MKTTPQLTNKDLDGLLQALVSSDREPPVSNEENQQENEIRVPSRRP